MALRGPHKTMTNNRAPERDRPHGNLGQKVAEQEKTSVEKRARA
jgi:hypothetical protein